MRRLRGSPGFRPSSSHWRATLSPATLGKGKTYIPLAVVIGAILVITGSALARIYLYAHIVIIIALIAAAIEGIVLIVYHFILKREDPEAL